MSDYDSNEAMKRLGVVPWKATIRFLPDNEIEITDEAIGISAATDEQIREVVEDVLSDDPT